MTMMTIGDSNNTSISSDDRIESPSLLAMVPTFVRTVEAMEEDEGDYDDGESSVSSLSSDDEPKPSCPMEAEDDEEPRILFATYWEKTGEVVESQRQHRKRVVLPASRIRSRSPQCVMRVNPIPCNEAPSFEGRRQQGHSSDEKQARSLFPKYWANTCEEESPQRQLFSSPSTSRHLVSQPSPFPNPFDVFGLNEDERDGYDDEDEYSINTYERMISHYDVTPRRRRTKSRKRSNETRRPYESKPLWSALFTSSAPSLSRQSSSMAAPSSSSLVGFRSAPVLHTKPLPSVLRKGRFSRSPNNTNNQMLARSSSQNQHVRFQPLIQVQSYQPPVESWAADGWSSWFGIWETALQSIPYFLPPAPSRWWWWCSAFIQVYTLCTY